MDLVSADLVTLSLAAQLLVGLIAWSAGAGLLLFCETLPTRTGAAGRLRRGIVALAAGAAHWAALLMLAAAVGGVPVAQAGAGALLAALLLASAVGFVLIMPPAAANALAPLAVAGQALVGLAPGFAIGPLWPSPVAAIAIAIGLVAGQAALRFVPALPLGGRPVVQLVVRCVLVGLAWLLPALVVVVGVPAAVNPVAATGVPWLAAALGLLLVALAGAALWLEGVPPGAPRRQFRPARTADAAPRRDALTGLPERDAIAQWIAKDPQARGAFGLLAIGLDGFKKINDAFGLRAGDAVIAEVGRRLSIEAAALQVPLLARTGGDEFTLVLPTGADRALAMAAAKRLLARVAMPTTVEGGEVPLAASAGLAFTPDDGDAQRLPAYAEAALRAAKQAGGDRLLPFEARLVDEARDRLELLRDLRRAIDERQLELFYQPKIDARSGQITAAEALLRWQHPVRGLIGPHIFIPLAERYGLINALGNWVIEDACRQANAWRKAGLKMRVAINLSASQMREDDLVDRILSALQRHGMDPSRLTCEITETVAMEDTEATQQTFARLGDAGVHVSIDDFGTGYSSLAYLRRLPAAELKIDRAFVKDLGESEDARAIVDAVVKMAHAIGKRVVAEGVETLRQRDVLLGLGCDELQGFLFAKPMTARALQLWAIEDRPAQAAFRPSLFADTATPTVVHPSTGARRPTRPFA